MTPNAELLTQVLSLSETERAEFAHRILLSLEPGEFDASWRQAWTDELSTRRAQLESGLATSRDWRDVIAEAQREIPGSATS